MTDARCANGSSSPGSAMSSLLKKFGNSLIRGRSASLPPSGCPPAQYILAFFGAPRAFSNLKIRDISIEHERTFRDKFTTKVHRDVLSIVIW